MRISNIDNKNKFNAVNIKNKRAFTGSNDEQVLSQLYDKVQDLKVKINEGIKVKDNGKVVKGYLENLNQVEEQIKEFLKNPDYNVKTPKIFDNCVKWFGKIKVEKTGNKVIDSASQLTKIVLWGNVGKEAVGTTLYTIQALTNRDLPPDKRKFVGMYDLSVGVVSTIVSTIFCLSLEKSLKKGYKKILKPISGANSPALKSRAAVAIAGLTAFTAFFLQTIIGKRIIAPAIGVPAAGKLRKGMEEKDAAKKQQLATK